jgi:hypothetical protein
MTTCQLIADRLIIEPPRIELSILRPFVGENAFLRRENFDSHPSHLSKGSAFCLDISIGPTEHLEDSTLLASLVLRALRYRSSLPNKVEGFKGLIPSLSRTIGTSNFNSKSILELGIN